VVEDQDQGLDEGFVCNKVLAQREMPTQVGKHSHCLDLQFFI
jgi:hypothetical protein